MEFSIYDFTNKLLLWFSASFIYSFSDGNQKIFLEERHLGISILYLQKDFLNIDLFADKHNTYFDFITYKIRTTSW